MFSNEEDSPDEVFSEGTDDEGNWSDCKVMSSLCNEELRSNDEETREDAKNPASRATKNACGNEKVSKTRTDTSRL